MKRLFWAVILLGGAVPGWAKTQSALKPVQFDVVSLKPDGSGLPHGLLQIFPDGDRIMVTNAPMFRIVEFAYSFDFNGLIEGAPDWTKDRRWDMEAKVAAADLPAFKAMNLEQQKSMLQPVLLERCKMKAHVEQRESPVYSLTVASSGLKMHELGESEAKPMVRDASGKVVDEWDLKMDVNRGEAHGRGVPVEALMYVLNTAGLARKVLDHTGLKGSYNFDLMWTPEEQLQAQAKDNADSGLAEAERPSIFTAVKEQLGLRLEASKAPVGVLVIDHIEKPTND
jgi:uncharacterized protein (TIGR03435 family)